MAERRLCQIAIEDIPCFEPADTFWDAGCKHEHVTADIGICAAHVERITGDPWTCHECQEIDGHECLAMIKEVAHD